jgi:thymidylate synthase ThyX
MTITAKIIADSVSFFGVRITTMELTYPRFIHAEFMTHRVFSRNASSSRAIPVKKTIQAVLDNPAMPIHWGKNQPGMQAREEHDAPVYVRDGRFFDSLDAQYEPITAKAAWLYARDQAVVAAQAFEAAGYHKQVVNRLLEPFSHITVVVTATEWVNFFQLRLHPDAQPEIHELAIQMKAAMDGSEPRQLASGQWHLPYVRPDEWSRWGVNTLLSRSVARCARVSYLNHDGTKSDANKDIEFAEGLRRDGHMSPFEHQATPRNGWSANFRGWEQFRQQL